MYIYTGYFIVITGACMGAFISCKIWKCHMKSWENDISNKYKDMSEKYDKLIHTIERDMNNRQGKIDEILENESNEEIYHWKKEYWDMLRSNLVKSCQLILISNTSVLSDDKLKELLESIKYNLDNHNPFDDTNSIQQNKELINLLIQVLEKCDNDDWSAYKDKIVNKLNECFNSADMDNYKDEIEKYKNKFCRL